MKLSFSTLKDGDDESAHARRGVKQERELNASRSVVERKYHILIAETRLLPVKLEKLGAR